MLGFADQNPDKDKLPEAAPPTPQGHEEVNAREEAHDVITKLAPWGISIVFHLGLVLLAIFLAWSTIQKTEDQEEVIIPIARLSPTPGAPLTSVSKTVSKSPSMTRSTTSASAATGQSNASFAGRTGATSSNIGLGASAGASSPFGRGVSAGSGPRASFFGLGGNATRLAYLVDASGSLIDTFPFVINELKRSIGELSEQQEFTVIFYQGDDVKQVPPAGLKKATNETKQRVIAWIDSSTGNIIPGGGTNPVKALQMALQTKPQLLFILSDNITGAGRFEVDRSRLLADIERTNTSKTKINTIQFIYPDPLVAKGMKATLEMISDQTGGIYKYLDARELQIK